MAVSTPDAMEPPDMMVIADTAPPPPDAAPAKLALVPLGYDFGNVEVSTASALVDFTVTNTGDVPSDVPTVQISAEFYVLNSTCTGPIDPQASCVLTLKLFPSSAGPKSGNLVVSATPGTTVSSALSGYGVTAPALEISPASRDFGNVAPGQASAEFTFTVKNTGGVASGVPTASVIGTNPASFVVSTDGCKKALASGDSCSIGVTFHAPTAGIGVKTAQLDVTANRGGTASATLRGNSSWVDVTPVSHDYGAVMVNATSPPSFAFTVKHLGGANDPQVFLLGSIGGRNQAVFGVDTTNCTNGLRGGYTCKVTVTFRPDTTGAKDATIEVAAHDASGLPAGSGQAALTGTGS
jgi:hypothetical protein